VIKTFISHTSSDHQFVEWLKIKLERENLGLDIFIDDDSISVGDDPQRMINEVKRAIIFIPVLSNESAKNEFVQNEIKTGIENETTHIFPVKLKCNDENIPKEIKMNFTAFDKVEGKIFSWIKYRACLVDLLCCDSCQPMDGNTTDNPQWSYRPIFNFRYLMLSCQEAK